jgi:hypothetical protein
MIYAAAAPHRLAEKLRFSKAVIRPVVGLGDASTGYLARILLYPRGPLTEQFINVRRRCALLAPEDGSFQRWPGTLRG